VSENQGQNQERERALNNQAEAAAYRWLMGKLGNLIHHAGDDRKVNLSGIKRAMATARKFAQYYGRSKP
jgi:hypothetical protein